MEEIIEGKDNIKLIKSSLHGYGISSTKQFQSNQIIFSEIPSLFLQSIPNKQDVIICGYCSRFVGTCGTQLMLLSREISRIEYMDDNLRFPGDIYLSNIIPCLYQCGEVYCSEKCRLNHLENGHTLLCTGHISEEEADENPLIQFKQHAVQTNEIFLLVGELFARFCSVLDRTGDIDFTISNVIQPYETFQRHLWWDVAVAPPHEQAKLCLTLQQLVTESWNLLNQTLKLEQRGIASILSPEYLARTIGMFEQNNVGVRLSNPISQYLLPSLQNLQLPIDIYHSTIDHLLTTTQRIQSVIEGEDCNVMDEEDWEDASDDDEEGEGEGEENQEENIESKEQHNLPTNLNEIQLEQIQNYQILQELISSTGEENLYPPLDGTSFYKTICRVNHSCVPNVIVKYISHPIYGLCAQMTALRDIGENEELVQSYIDNTLGTEERQALLKDYGFECTCSLCQTGNNNSTNGMIQSYCVPCL